MLWGPDRRGRGATVFTRTLAIVINLLSCATISVTLHRTQPLLLLYSAAISFIANDPKNASKKARSTEKIGNGSTSVGC